MGDGTTYDAAMGGPGTMVRAEAFDGRVPSVLATGSDAIDFSQMGGANAMQVGGQHYAKRDYQHWDFVVDAGLGYLAGNATKYASRWRDKNGLQDLEKCGHYILKLRELKEDGYEWPRMRGVRLEAVERFCAQLPAVDAELVRYISLGKLKKAAAVLSTMTALAASGDVA